MEGGEVEGVEGGGGGEDAGVVEGDVEAAVGGDSAGDEALDVGFFADVGLDEGDVAAGGLDGGEGGRGFGLVAGTEDDLGSTGGEEFGGDGADAGAAAW